MAIIPKERAVTAAQASEAQTLKERYAAVKQRIAAAAKRAGRTPDSIVLVAVTKYASIDQVRELVELGHVDLGESQMQNLLQRAAQIDEFQARMKQLGGKQAKSLKPVRWHMIGHLQRNKVRKVAGLVRLIHSVDSLRLAEEIQACSTRLDQPVEVLIQVNVSGEKSKFGIAPAAAKHLIDQMDTMINIRVRGLMCMAPLTDDASTVRNVFDRTRELFGDIARSGAAGERFDILSMGMSQDFETAIECGANMVRVGSAIFGATGLESDGDGSSGE
ncbi:MAG: YggS family pyridoxal phosphate-dependent enzyme [Phycisphaerales bacterium]|nr:YggS family pyridoxal phosphate-dependent enzyme [Phycisphaerales bacterium]MCI0676648.1 YggS family pyridoxal phosphate-dependent enzyme [Phycisphaerales bacterium]